MEDRPGRTALLDDAGRVGQHGWSSITYAFCRVTVCSTEKEKQRSQGTVEAKRAYKNKIKFKRRKHAVESLHKSGTKLGSLFMFDSTVVVLELHGLPACAMYTNALARRGTRHHAHA